MPILGVIADDFTGAGDIASFLVKGGMNTVLLMHFDDARDVGLRDDADAIVIALKTRTEQKDMAVAHSLQALAFLKEKGCTHFYIKYCSTFDSTKEGNIGPVCDAVMEALGCRRCILCPALPINGRRVTGGRLYVNGRLLEESSMKDHPLTPMRESDLVRLMESQSRYRARKLGKPEDKWRGSQFDAAGGAPVYLVPDAEDEEDLRRIAAAFGDDVLLSGGSGIAPYLASHLLNGVRHENAGLSAASPGHALILAGSCSAATREQIEAYETKNGVSVRIQARNLLAANFDSSALIAEVEEKLRQGNVLVYSSDTPEHTEQLIREQPFVPERIERLMGFIAAHAAGSGCHKIIVAGGETSGAVTRALQIDVVHIGDSIAPGVPVMMSLKDPRMKLVLKSGNFGQRDFFEQAINAISK